METDDRLDNHARDGTTEPDERGPFVRDTKKLDVRCEERELERPPELYPARHGGDAEEHALRGF